LQWWVNQLEKLIPIILQRHKKEVEVNEMPLNEKQSELIDAYQSLVKKEGYPDWAVKNRKTNGYINPSIPYIGEKYFTKKRKIAIYAMAESLTYYLNSNDENPLLESDDAWNRHGVSFTHWLASPQEGRHFFPDVHIQPINSGGLLCAAAFILYKMGWDFNSIGEPKDFLSELVVAHYGKFSCREKTSKDYARNWKLLRPSLPYLEKDLNVLQPDVLIFVGTIFRHKQVAKQIRSLLPNSTIFPIYQFAPRIIHGHLLAEFNERAGGLEKELADKFPLLSKWTNKMKGYNMTGIYRFYAHLESVINSASVGGKEQTSAELKPSLPSPTTTASVGGKEQTSAELKPSLPSPTTAISSP